eukprot:2547535-Rhodomonas_salina.1
MAGVASNSTNESGTTAYPDGHGVSSYTLPFTMQVECSTTGSTTSVPKHLSPRGAFMTSVRIRVQNVLQLPEHAWHACSSPDPAPSVVTISVPRGQLTSTHRPVSASSCQTLSSSRPSLHVTFASPPSFSTTANLRRLAQLTPGALDARKPQLADLRRPRE